MSSTAGVTLAPTPDAPGAGRRASPTAPPQRFWDLEGLRGLSALLIVVFHAYQFTTAGGRWDFENSAFFGIFLNLAGLVGVFFALSAFVLWRPVVDRVMAGEPAMKTRQWVVRRGVRILPLYFFVIVTVWVTRNPHFPGDWRDLVEHLTFTEVFDSKRIFYTDGPAWSVAVEVMFYALLAVIGWTMARGGVHRMKEGRRWLLLAAPLPLLLLIGPGYAYWSIALRNVPVTSWAPYFGPLAWSTSFGAGMVLAMAHVAYVRRNGGKPLPGWSLIGMRLLAVVIFYLASAYPAATPVSLTVFRLAAGVSAALLLASSVFAPPTSLWRRILGAKALLFAALLSYSLYMWHEPVLLLLNAHHLLSHSPEMFPVVAVILLAASLPVAYLSYRFIERPAGFLRYLLETRRPQAGHRPEGQVVGAPRVGVPAPAA